MAHGIGIAGAILSMYGLVQMRTVTGLITCAIGGVLIGMALGRLL